MCKTGMAINLLNVFFASDVTCNIKMPSFIIIYVTLMHPSKFDVKLDVGSIYYLSSIEGQRESRVISVATLTYHFKNRNVYMTEPHRSITVVVIDRISRARVSYEDVNVIRGGRWRDGDGLDGEFGVGVCFVGEQEDQEHGDGGE